MGILFLVGLLAVIAVITIIVVTVICGKWLKDYVAEKLKNRSTHKVVFANTKDVVNNDDNIKAKVANSAEFSMEDLEKMCDDVPCVAAVMDEDGEISEYEGFTFSEYNENFKERMKKQNGLIILEA